MCNFIKSLNEYDDFIQLKGVSKDNIADAESELGVRFSNEYREYLIECGIASADGHEFTGIGNSERLSVVLVTREERLYNPNVPKELYVVENLGIDRIIIWQDQLGYIYHTVADGSPKKIAESLYEYVVQDK